MAAPREGKPTGPVPAADVPEPPRTSRCRRGGGAAAGGGGPGGRKRNIGEGGYAVFGPTWRTSERRYEVVVERDRRIPMPDGVTLSADVFRPAADGRFPAILGYHPYEPDAQTAPIRPRSFASVTARTPGMERGNGPLEAGDPYFFARRGYVHVVCNVRGTGRSGGTYAFLGPPEPQDGAAVIAWMAAQPWCDGNVGMFGVSYFARIAHFVAALQPPALRCIFAPWASTDQYRDALYQGGILSWRWALAWVRSFSDCRYESDSRSRLGEDGLRRAVAAALADPEIAAVPELVAVLNHPDEGINPLLVDILLNPLDGPFWAKRRVDYSGIRVPAYIGGDWGMYGLHLPAAFRGWERLNVPKRLLIGPPAYLDRPIYQLQYESLRWFDHWLKGNDTGLMEGPPVRLFMTASRTWREAADWPLPETCWTPFFLHENGLLWEREHLPGEGASTFDDSPWGRGALTFTTPPLVEETEVIGPVVLELHASTTGEEVLWFLSLREVDAQGGERVLTRGWQRGTLRTVDPDRSKPWLPHHPFERREPLQPGRACVFHIPLVPAGHVFRAGGHIRLKIACTDDEAINSLEMLANGHVHHQAGTRVTVYHDADHPSRLWLPVTRGNVIGTYIEGARPYL